MIKAVIIENEKIASDFLTSLLQDVDKDIVINGYATTAKDAILLIQQVNPDIVFLDIELDQGDGFEVLAAIQEKTFQVIFTTGHNIFYKEALDHFALSYLLKPINPDKLRKSIAHFKKMTAHQKENKSLQLFKQFIESKNQKIFLPVGDNYIPVEIEHIVLCQAQGNYTTFFLSNGITYDALGILKHYDKLLEQKAFFRANRSTLVHLKHIKKVHRKETIVLNNNMNIPIATRKRQELDQVLKTLI